MTNLGSNLQQCRHVLVIDDQKAKRIVALEESTYSIGRDSSNSIIIYDYQVSRYHATLLRVTDYQSNQQTYRLIDGNLDGKKSTNGISVNGSSCLSHELKHGDLINFGSKAQASYQIIADPANAVLLTETESNKIPDSSPLTEEFKKTLISHQEFTQLSQEDLFRLASFPELSPNPIVEIDWDGNVTYLNPAATAKFPEIHQAKLNHPILADLLSKTQQGNLFVRDIQIGQEVFEQYVHYLFEAKLIRSYLFELTKRKQAEARLKESEERYRAVIKQASEGIFLADAINNCLIEANAAYCNLLGYTPAEMLELKLDDIIVVKTDTLDNELQQIRKQRDFIGESLHRSKDGSLINVEVGVSLVCYGDKELFCFVVRDITKRKQSEKTLQHRAFHDLLTDLPNRTLFCEQLTTALANAKRYQQLMAVMFIDLDHFKTINDMYGHGVGDRLLQDFADRLNVCVRSGDTVARWGGDEFTVLLPHVASVKDIAKISTRILDALKQPFEIEPNQLYLQTSIGIAIYPQDGEDAEVLLRHADAALYRTKKQGRNSYRFYSSTMNSKTSVLLRLEKLLYQALEEKQFSLDYQPQVKVNTGAVSGMEALLRWHHPELGQVTPGKFIALAEETSLIIPIGKWILETACAQNKAWQKAGLPAVRVAVNLSPRQFQQSNLPDLVAQVLAQTELEPQYLELEVAEAAIAHNVDFARKTLQELHQIGVCIAIDDFGSGNSSINYLKQFSLKTLKLDRSFVQKLRDVPEDIAIVSALIALGRGFRVRVVAEGVETPQQFELLRRLQCEEMQGYRFSHPLTLEEATKFLGSYSSQELKSSAHC